MVRRFRRIGRRRPRRLRRFRRARRYYGRRRFRRVRRYRRRRGYGRRRRFYSRKGQKTAIAFLTPNGKKLRTYRFWLSKTILQDYDGAWRSGNSRLDINTNTSWTIAYGKTYTWDEAHNLNNMVHTWTGPGCMYSVTDLPITIQRALGYDQYTVINLGWFDIFYLQAIGYYPNQKRLIEFDLQNYSYYKPISVTCKLIPRYPRGPSKFGSYFPTVADMKIAQPPALTTGVEVPAGATATNPNPAVPVTSSTFTVTQANYKMLWDEDSRNLVAYLIPLSGQGLPPTLKGLDPRLVVANSIFSSVLRVPTNDFISSFRKAGYSRTTISHTRPTRFVYKFTRNNLSEKMQIPPEAYAYNANMNIQLGMKPNGFWQNIRWGSSQDGYSMFSRTDQILDSLKKDWIPAELRTVPVYRSGLVSGSGQGTGFINMGDLIDTASMELLPIDSCAVFIPGIDTDSLMTMYNVQFSFTCAFAGRTYDMT